MRLKIFDGLLCLTMKLLKSLDKRETGIEHFEPEKVRNILLVSSTAIGDTLLSTPAIRAVRERYPEAKIIAHLNANNMELFENNPHIDKIIPYYGGYKKFCETVKAFRNERFDLALILHGNEPQATPMAYLSGARFIIKLPNTSEYRFLLSNKDDILGWKDFAHAAEQRLRVVELAGCGTSDNKMVLPLTGDGELFAERFIKENGITGRNVIIGFQAGASTISRMWFPERFAELGKRLVALNPGIRIILTGSPNEHDYCKKIADAIGKEAIVSAGRVPLKFLPSLIKRFTALVTGDTGTMHIAVAAGTPVVALYAVSDPQKSGPYYGLDKHAVINKERTCDPCASKKCKYQKCMEQISVDEVYNEARIIFEKAGGVISRP
ncbi:MAG: glycosyltransferase family 9 protein [Nitrospirae bacterium]|nr:glycosyltransferase family 9 protein [Nitrospirota bacterium]